MPQLDTASFISQLFWLTISFSFLYMVLSRLSIPVIAEIRQSRQEKISGDLDRAENIRQEAESIEHEYRQSSDETNKEAAEIISDAVDRTANDADKRYGELDDILAKKLDDAEKNIVTLKEKAVAEVASVSTDLAEQVVKQIAKLKVTQKQAADVVSSLMKENQ